MKLVKSIVIMLLCIASAFHLYGYNETQYARFFINKTCRNCDLYKANFSGADLTNADFTGSNLIYANFQNATLYGANFTNVSMAGANFTGAMWIDGSMCEEGSLGTCIKKKSGNQ